MNKDVLISRLTEIDNRVKEIKGEINALDFRIELGKIDARLYRMKRKTNMYELSLLDEEVGRIKSETQISKMLSDLGIRGLLNNINPN